MDLFILDDGFVPIELVEGYSSAIWTERFFTYGDIEITVPATPAYQALLAPDVKIGHAKSREVMIIEDHDVDDGTLKVTGRTIDAFFENRLAWLPDGTSMRATETIGYMLTWIVNRFIIKPDLNESQNYTGPQLNWVREKMPFFEIGYVDLLGEKRPYEVSTTDVYSALNTLAQANGVGFRFYLDHADEDGYLIKFTAWRGRDLTSNQDDNPLVRLSPLQNSLMNTKEVLSVKSYKNVVYVIFSGQTYTFYAEPTLPIPTGFDRRSMTIEAEGIVPDGDYEKFRRQRAADAFANNNYIRAIDGQATIPSEYIYGRDYILGDIIELEGLTGLLTKARVTEYIRTEDSTGDREYPTIAVVDPLDTGNMPITSGVGGGDPPDGPGDPPADPPGEPPIDIPDGEEPPEIDFDEPDQPSDKDDPDPNNPPKSDKDKDRRNPAPPPPDTPADPDPDPDQDPDDEPDPDPDPDFPPIPPGPLVYFDRVSVGWNSSDPDNPVLDDNALAYPAPIYDPAQFIQGAPIGYSTRFPINHKIGTLSLPYDNVEYFMRSMWNWQRLAPPIAEAVPWLTASIQAAWEFVHPDWDEEVDGPKPSFSPGNPETFIFGHTYGDFNLIAIPKWTSDRSKQFLISRPGLWYNPTEDADTAMENTEVTGIPGSATPPYFAEHMKHPSIIQNRYYASGYPHLGLERVSGLHTPDIALTGPQEDRLTKMTTYDGHNPPSGDYDIVVSLFCEQWVDTPEMEALDPNYYKHWNLANAWGNRWFGSVASEVYYRTPGSPGGSPG